MADTERKEVIYTDGGGRGSGSTAIVVVAVLAILVVLFLMFGRGLVSGTDAKSIKADVDINVPAGGKSG